MTQVMSTDDMLIAYSDNAKELVDSIEKKLNDSFKVTPRSNIDHYMESESNFETNPHWQFVLKLRLYSQKKTQKI